MAVYLLALGAALLFGVGSVAQQHAAAQAPPGYSLSFRLLLWLVQRPLWLVGVGTAVVGNLLSGTALGLGSVALVQPLLVTRLLFALPLAAAWMRRRVPRRDWGGALATGVGLGAFIVAGQPMQGEAATVPGWRWAIAIGTIAALVLGIVIFARRLRPAREAPLLGAGAGMLFGLQAGLTHTAVQHFSDGGIVGILSAPATYGVAAAAIGATLLAQSAYEMAPLTASYPATAGIEPLAGIAIGVGVIGGSIRLSPGALAVELVGLAVMLGGIYLLATSALVTGQLDLLERRQEQGLARRTEAELERDLKALRRDLAQIEGHITTPGRHRAAPDDLRRDLGRVDDELGRLAALAADIRVHREQGQERVADRPRADKAAFATYEQQLDRWQDEITARSDRLQEQAGTLRRQAELVLGGPL